MPTKNPQKKTHEQTAQQKNGKKQMEVRFPRGGQKPKIQYYELTCSGVGEKETLNINVVGTNVKTNNEKWQQLVILPINLPFWYRIHNLDEKMRLL